jgi:hypothetical protein
MKTVYPKKCRCGKSINNVSEDYQGKCRDCYETRERKDKCWWYDGSKRLPADDMEDYIEETYC